MLLVLSLLLLLWQQSDAFESGVASWEMCLRSVLRISCLFLRPRPWQFEILDSTDKQATYLLLGFETLNLKFCDLKL